MGTCIKKDELWIGLSPKNPTKISPIKQFIDDNLPAYKQSAKYKSLLKEYNILLPEIELVK